MTPRERLIAATRGEPTDRKPVICWPKSCPESDAAVLECGDLSPLSTAEPARLRLVLNPFGKALQRGIPLNATLDADPQAGEQLLGGLVAETKEELAGDTLYLVYGATPERNTPMQYGGHYLERDREILADAQGFTVAFIVGGEDTYLDFVSDLPASVFAWDSQGTGVSVAQIREMRQGALAANSPEADIEFRFGVPNVSAHLEMQLKIAHAV